eukprot:PITA_19974
MLHAKSLPHKLWAEALNYYIQKISPHRYVKDQTPFEAWSNTKQGVTHFCVFGSQAWAKIPSEMRKALGPQSIECIFVGYPDRWKGYQLLISSTYKFIIERIVKFEESLLHAPQLPHENTFYLPHVQDDDSVHSDADTEHADAKRIRSLSEIYAQDHPPTINGLVGDNSDPWRTSSKFVEPPLALTATKPMPSRHCHLVQSFDAQSYVEGIWHPSWGFAMEEEYNSQLEN